MTTESPGQLTINEFLKYKPLNTDMLPELVEYYNNNKNKFNRHGQGGGHGHGHGNAWRKFEQKPADNWLVVNKFKQNNEEKLYSQFRSILNKLSDGNFNSLATELTTLEITSSEHLTKLTEFIFNKAIIEPKFGYMYAKLAKELAGYSLKEDEKVYYFRELLIGKCQLMFNDCVSFDPENASKSLITKETAVGCMSFIGELYLYDLLTNKIINSCFLLLLMKAGQNKSHIIECISTLMKVAGKLFTSKCPADAKLIFDKIDKLITSGTLQNKDKFALMDIIDLKKNGKW